MTLLSAVADDLTWCWWTRPRAVRVGGALYTSGITSSGDVFVSCLEDAAPPRLSVLASIEPDDHNNPAIVIDPQRPALAFYSRHDVDQVIRYRSSAGPLDIENWAPERTIEFAGITTYAQVHPRGDELHLLTRVGDIGWGYCRSADWAQTWADPVSLIQLDTDQETYLASALLTDGRTVRLAIAGHPKEYEAKPVHDVYTCLLDLDSGELRRPTDGALIGNARTGEGLPLTEQSMESVYVCPADRTLNLLDISDSPATEIAFVSKVKDDLTTQDARYHVSRHTPEGWVTEEVAAAGTIFGYIPAGFYVGGMAFPTQSCGGEVYLSRESGGDWFLERWTFGDDRWTGETIVPPTTQRLVRPWCVSGSEPTEVLALALERYDDDYMETQSRLELVKPATRGGQP